MDPTNANAINQQLMQQFLNMLPEAALCFDENGEIIEYNDIATQLIGTQLKSGQNILNVCTIKMDLPGFLNIVNSNGYAHTLVELSSQDTHSHIYRLSARILNGPQSSAENRNHYCAQLIRLPENTSNAQLASHYETIFNNLREAVFLAPVSDNGVHQNFIDVNKTACERLGYSREQLLNMNARSINPDANLSKVKSWGRHVKREKTSTFEAIHISLDGTHIPVEITATIITLNEHDYILSVARDMRAVSQHVSQESRFGRMLDHSWNEIYIFNFDDLHFIQVNQGALDNLGYSHKEIEQLTITDIMSDISTAEFRTLTQPLVEGKQSQVIYETVYKRKNGTIYPVEIRLQLSVNEVPPLFLATTQDISERKKIESRLKQIANYDTLTGLPNRALLVDRLNVALDNTRRSETLTAILFVDLDGFKQINDTMGHSAGDELIKEIAGRFKTCLRKSDTVARLGGDEFIILLTNVKSVNGVDTAAEKILRAANTPVLIGNTEINISASIGITLYPLDDDTTEDAYKLMKQADSAMYDAKNNGKNNFRYYTPIIAHNEFKKAQIENGVKSALKNNQLYITYQARVDLIRNRITGAEALLRWQHPELGLINPTEFIPIMESNGVIREIGTWVIRQACQQIKTWMLEGYQYKVSVNVSARQFDDDSLPQILHQHISENGIPAELLQIEITEGLLISESERATINLHKIRAMGIRIAMDDFGTGYSSLNYLRQFPIDIIKIDRAFTRDLEKSEDSHIIIDAIITLASKLGIHVIAEGVETQHQREVLIQLGCTEGQGFFFSRPLLPNEFKNIQL